MSAINPSGPRGLVMAELPAAVLASLDSAVIVTEVDGTIVWVNQAFTAMSGYSAAEALGTTPRLLKSGVQGKDYYARLWSTICEARVWRGDVVERRKDGTSYSVMQTITPMVDTDGEITHFIAVHEDVSELRGSQARLQALFDHASDAMVLFDDTGRLVEANGATTALTGYDPHQLATMAMHEMVPRDHHDRYAQQWAQFRAEGYGRGNLPIIRSDGQWIEVDYRAVANITPGVNLLVGRDVTVQHRLEGQQRFQAQLLEAVGEAVIATDLNESVVYVNPAAERLYGWSKSDVLGTPINELTVPGDAPTQEEAQQILSQVRNGASWTGQFEVRRSDGSTFPALVTNSPYFDAAGQLGGTIGSSTDISDLDRTRRLLLRRAQQQTAVAQLGHEAMNTDDPRSLAILALDKAAELVDPDIELQLCWGTEPPPSQPISDDMRIKFGAAGTLVITGGGADELSTPDHKFLRSLAHVVDSAARRHAATAQLQHLATHDSLTGLSNRALFLDRLEQSRVACQLDEAFAVFFLDLDVFKSVNDGLGHEAGDEVLRLAADRLASIVHPRDTLARFGGDEFALLCPDIADERAAAVVAGHILTELADGIVTEQGTVVVTASIGIALGDRTTEGSALLRNVDTAMYAAKKAGRNRAELFDVSMQDQAHHRFKMTATLRSALAEGSIEVRYQPTIELATGRIIGVEALARLRGDDGALIPPDQFIGIAEDTGLIAALGEQVLRRACGDARPWIAADPNFMLSVNLSPHQLTHGDVTDVIQAILAATGVAPQRLWLEITESTYLSGPGVHATMQRLRQSGIRLAIDDFGTGYSSLSHLRHTPVDMLKIDRSFVSGLHADIQDHALVAATIHLARAFNLPTTAEGVETPEQLAELTQLGCDYAQGYLWNPPVHANAISELLHIPATQRPESERPSPV